MAPKKSTKEKKEQEAKAETSSKETESKDSKETESKSSGTKEKDSKVNKVEEERKQRIEMLKRKAAAAQVADKEMDGYEEYKDYLPSPDERHLVHAVIEKPAFSKESGKRLSKPRVQKFTQKAFKTFKANAKNLGWSRVDLIWNPELYASTE